MQDQAERTLGHLRYSDRPSPVLAHTCGGWAERRARIADVRTTRALGVEYARARVPPRRSSICSYQSASGRRARCNDQSMYPMSEAPLG